MYDAHYDLLTAIYFRMKKTNKNYNIKKLISDLNIIYKENNIKGGIVNLYFMSLNEMKEELDIDPLECNDVSKMFLDSINYLEILKQDGIIQNNIDFLYSIEGCDYIKDENELEKLYNMGLRSILLVWNEKNKYASGIRFDGGLTDLGKKFLNKAIDLGIIIDVSHANEETFFDIMDFIEEKQETGQKVFVIASHSNSKNLCDSKRNLTDTQLKRLKEVGGYIGVLLHGGFLLKENEQVTIEERKPYFEKQISYMRNVIGFDDDKIFISTDNMNYHPDPEYHHLGAFEFENMSSEVRNYLGRFFDKKFVDKIMIENMKNLFSEVRNYDMKCTLSRIK